MSRESNGLRRKLSAWMIGGLLIVPAMCIGVKMCRTQKVLEAEPLSWYQPTNELRRVELRVVTSDGNPIVGAEVIATLGAGAAMSEVAKYTDSQGVVEFDLTAAYGISYRVAKDLFYESKGHWFGDETLGVVSGCTVRLREMRNPIAMYVKRLHLPLPVSGQWVKVDLRKGSVAESSGGGGHRAVGVLFRGVRGAERGLHGDESVVAAG